MDKIETNKAIKDLPPIEYWVWVSVVGFKRSTFIIKTENYNKKNLFPRKIMDSVNHLDLTI